MTAANAVSRLRRIGVRRTVSRQYASPGRSRNMTGAIPALSFRRRSLLAALCLGAASALISAPAFGPRSRWHRRRRGKGDRRGSQYLDDSRRSKQRAAPKAPRHSTTSAGIAVRGVLRRLLQEPPRRQGVAACNRTRQTRSAPDSSSIPPASRSPITTSSPIPTRSTSS